MTDLESIDFGGRAKPVAYVVMCLGDDTPWSFRIPGYFGDTADEVIEQVLTRARREGYKRTVADRMAELGWWVEPVFLWPGPISQVPIGHISLRSVRELRAGRGDELIFAKPLDLNNVPVYITPQPAQPSEEAGYVSVPSDGSFTEEQAGAGFDAFNQASEIAVNDLRLSPESMVMLIATSCYTAMVKAAGNPDAST